VTGTFLDEDALDDAAERIGIGALKYYDLKQNRKSDYAFSYKKMLDPKGNTGVYLLYSYARLCSILRKAGITQENMAELYENNQFEISHETERNLAISLLKLPEIIDNVMEELNLNRICDLIYEIAVNIGHFYTQCKTIGTPQQNSRLLLVEATRSVMQTLFYFIGIKPLEKL
jgi:arginyl-tRNA synthetase